MQQCRPENIPGRHGFDWTSVPGIKNDLPHCLRIPIADLLQFFRAQLPAEAAPVPVQLIRPVHRSFAEHPLSLYSLCTAGLLRQICLDQPTGVAPAAGWPGTLFEPRRTEFGRIEVPCGSVRIHFCHRPAALPCQGVAHPAERLLVQQRRRLRVRAPKSGDPPGKQRLFIRAALPFGSSGPLSLSHRCRRVHTPVSPRRHRVLLPHPLPARPARPACRPR